MRAEYITQKAQDALSKYGENPFDAARQSGVALCYKDLGTLKGAYFGNMDTPAIVLNENLEGPIREIVCAHELGHHILHRGQIFSCENIMLENAAILEREANIFAAEFLIDKARAISLLSQGYSVAQTASMLETDESLLLYLLNALKLTEAPSSDYLK